MSATYNFVIVSLQPWDLPIGSNCKNIALELSKKHRVLYINNSLDVSTYLSKNKSEQVQNRLEVIRGKRKQLEQVNDQLWVFTPNSILLSTNALPKGWIFEAANLYNNKVIAKGIRSAISSINMKNYYLFNDSDMFRGFYLKELLQANAYFYYSRDNLLAVPFWQKHGSKHEPLLIAKSDACFSNSTYLQKQLAQYNPNSFYIGQGCDLTEFDPHIPHPRPIDLPHGKKIIGYVGVLLELRLDIALMSNVAKALPHYNFVLVGSEDEAFKKSELHQLNNVFFLGAKTPASLPEYIAHFDVCINPQVLNAVTMGNYPRKIDEYLAMGKPVVASHTATMLAFEPHVYLAENTKEFAHYIEQATQEDCEALQAARIAFAQSHTWENSVAGIYKVIEKLCLKK